MKVLLVHNRYRDVGGEEVHLDLLERALGATGVGFERFEVDSSSLAGGLAQLRAASTIAYAPRSRRLLRDVVRHAGADIVHFHNIWPLLTPAALAGARDVGARVVLTVHNYRFACPNGTLFRRGAIHNDCLAGSSFLCGLRSVPDGGGKVVAYGAALSFQRRLRLLARWVDAFIAPTHFVANTLRRAGYGSVPIHVVPHGVEHGMLKRMPAAGSGHLLFAGRLSREKGIEVLRDAAWSVPHVPVVIAGRGPMEQTLARERPPSMTLAGFADRARLGELRTEAVATVVPSVCNEVAGYSAIESITSGRPVIATRVGGLSELVEHGATGLLVEPNDSEGLAAAMARIWGDRKLASRLGEAAANRAQREHHLAAFAERVVAVYRVLVAQ